MAITLQEHSPVIGSQIDDEAPVSLHSHGRHPPAERWRNPSSHMSHCLPVTPRWHLQLPVVTLHTWDSEPSSWQPHGYTQTQPKILLNLHIRANWRRTMAD